MRRADFLRERVSHDGLWDRIDNFRRRIALLGFVAVVVRVHLDELREIHAIPKTVTHGVNVRAESISGDLESLRGSSRAEFRNEIFFATRVRRPRCQVNTSLVSRSMATNV